MILAVFTLGLENPGLPVILMQHKKLVCYCLQNGICLYVASNVKLWLNHDITVASDVC